MGGTEVRRKWVWDQRWRCSKREKGNLREALKDTQTVTDGHATRRQEDVRTDIVKWYGKVAEYHQIMENQMFKVYPKKLIVTDNMIHWSPLVRSTDVRSFRM